MTFGLINACYSLPEWQAVTFFAPCLLHAPPTLPPIQEMVQIRGNFILLTAFMQFLYSLCENENNPS